MEPIAAGFMVTIAGAAVLGVVVGAIGGAVAWRLRVHLVLGLLLTASAFFLMLFLDYHAFFFRAEASWGLPPVMLTFLISFLSARWLGSLFIRRIWVTFAALGVALALGFSYLMLFRISLTAPGTVALWADAILAFVLIGNRIITRQR